MIEKKPDSFSDIVDRAMGELRSSPVPPELPPELLSALLQAAKEHTGAVQCTVEASAQAEINHPTLLSRSLETWRWIMRHPVCRTAAAAILVLVIVGVALWFHAGGATSAFADFVQPILDAKSAKYTMTAKMEGQPTSTTKVTFLLPYRMRHEWRQEMPGRVEMRMVTIWDLQKGKTILLNPERKTAIVTTYTDMPKDRANPFAELRSLLLDVQERPKVKREPLGEKEIDGHKAVGYRLSGLYNSDMVMSLWGDPETGLPVRVEMNYPRSSGRELQVTMNDFVLNVELDESLFSVEPPEGYATEHVQMDGSLPGEKDLIETLRQYSQQGAGTLPDMLDVWEDCTADFKVGKAEPTNGKRPSEGQIKEANKKVERQPQVNVVVDTTGTRGLRFVLALPPDADAHYAGKGVKLGAADKPIFWYRPKDSKRYRVIYADLSVREADTAPSVANAQPVGNASGLKK
jgi:outer membrane lipoprotein-sorting protein